MTKKSLPRTDGVSGPECPAAATVTTADEVKDSTIFKIKNLTSVETNNDNITREELKSIQKSLALFRQDIRKIFHEELFKFLNQKQLQQ
jgi:hypothetical protein